MQAFLEAPFYTQAADMWSVGMLLFRLATGQYLWVPPKGSKYDVRCGCHCHTPPARSCGAGVLTWEHHSLLRCHFLGGLHTA